MMIYFGQDLRCWSQSPPTLVGDFSYLKLKYCIRVDQKCPNQLNVPDASILIGPQTTEIVAILDNSLYLITISYDIANNWLSQKDENHSIDNHEQILWYVMAKYSWHEKGYIEKNEYSTRSTVICIFKIFVEIYDGFEYGSRLWPR